MTLTKWSRKFHCHLTAHSFYSHSLHFIAAHTIVFYHSFIWKFSIIISKYIYTFLRPLSARLYTHFVLTSWLSLAQKDFHSTINTIPNEMRYDIHPLPSSSAGTPQKPASSPAKVVASHLVSKLGRPSKNLSANELLRKDLLRQLLSNPRIFMIFRTWKKQSGRRKGCSEGVPSSSFSVQ